MGGQGALSECVLWRGGTNKPNGYGRLTRNGRRVLAHRDAYEKTYGPIPDGLVVRHRCDVKRCINPDHLEIGTVEDNNRDARERGQWLPLTGEEHGRAQLTENDVRTIRKRYVSGMGQQLADEYGVSRTQIRNIVQRKQWKHVP